jgi:hypothetical protein
MLLPLWQSETIRHLPLPLKNEIPHTNDGEESTVPKVANDDDGLSNVVIPRKLQEPKPTTRK